VRNYITGTSEIELHFTYPDLENPILKSLRQIVDNQLALPNDEGEAVLALAGYAHSLFAHDGTSTPSASDPLTILQEANAGMEFRCVEYAILATGLLWAHRIPARTVGLKVKDVETRKYGAGHVVIEYWSSELQKWVMCDVQAGVIPTQAGTYLSAYELSVAIEAGAQVDFTSVLSSRFVPGQRFGGKASYLDWISEYLYFMDTPLNLTLESEDRRLQRIAMLIPVGVPAPTSFQGLFDMNAVYTHSVLDFYPQFAD